jgi:hypothetical protein
MSQQEFMQCLQGAVEVAKGIDFSRGNYTIPLDDGDYNGMLTGFETSNGEKDSKPWFRAQASFTVTDGPSKDKVFKDNPMWFRPDEQELTIDLERLCRLATTISGEECTNPPEAFAIITEAVDQVAIGFAVRTSAKGNKSLYPNKRI